MKVGEAFDKARMPVALLVMIFLVLFVFYRVTCAGIWEDSAVTLIRKKPARVSWTAHDPILTSVRIPTHILHLGRMR